MQLAYVEKPQEKIDERNNTVLDGKLDKGRAVKSHRFCLLDSRNRIKRLKEKILYREKSRK